MIFARRALGMVFWFALWFALGQASVARAQAVEPAPQASSLVVIGDPHDARAANLVVLDSVVFVLGVGVLGGILVWWGRRIFKEK